VRSSNPPDFNLIVTINVGYWVDNTTFIITGIGYATITGHPDWAMVSHKVYLDTNAFRDVFIAVTGFSETAVPGLYQVTIHTKVLPLISFVWLGAFLMVSAILPIFGMEAQSFVKALRGKQEHLYLDEEEVAVEVDNN
jgi:hypothetical protein